MDEVLQMMEGGWEGEGKREGEGGRKGEGKEMERRGNEERNGRKRKGEGKERGENGKGVNFSGASSLSLQQIIPRNCGFIP